MLACQLGAGMATTPTLSLSKCKRWLRSANLLFSGCAPTTTSVFGSRSLMASPRGRPCGSRVVRSSLLLAGTTRSAHVLPVWVPFQVPQQPLSPPSQDPGALLPGPVGAEEVDAGGFPETELSDLDSEPSVSPGLSVAARGRGSVQVMPGQG